MKNRFHKKSIVIFLISFLILSFFLYVFAPGILSYDSYNQLNQIKTNTYSNWHPFFHTFIELVLLKVYDSPVTIAIFQILVFSLIWTWICHYKRTNTKKVFLLQIILTFIICFNPLNFTYAITLWKDILFSYMLLLTCFMTYIINDNNYHCSNRFIFFYGIVLSFLAQLRYNGLYIAIIMTIVISFLLYKKGLKNKNYILLPVVTIFGILAISSLNIVFNVVDNDKNAVEPKVMQILTYYLKEDKISKKDIKTISKVANINKLKKKYSFSYTDPIYSVTKHKQYKKHKNELFSMVIKYSVKNPKELVYFTFKSTSFVWNPLFPEDRIGLVINTDINSKNNTLGIKPFHTDDKIYIFTNRIIKKTLDIEFFKVLLYSPALYMYITFILGIVLYYKKKYRINLVLLPNLINLLLVALSNPIHDVRYIYPNILVLYLIIVILISKNGGSYENN